MKDFMPWLALLTTLVSFAGLYALQRKRVDFGIRTIVGMVLGLIIGFFFTGYTEYVTPFGQVYTNLIFAMVGPLLMFSIVSSVSGLNNVSRLKSLGFKSIFWLLLGTAIASTLTVVIATSLNLGANFSITLPTDYVAKEVPTIVQTLVAFFPNNVIAHLASNQVIPVIVFSLLLGVALVQLNTKHPEEAAPAIKFFSSMNKVINTLVKNIIQLTPFAVVAFIANVPTRESGKDLASFAFVIVVAYILCFIQAFLVNGALVAIFAKINPIKFFKAIWPAQVVAFTTQSSIGTVPVLAERLTDELDLKEDIVGFVTGLGANMGMAACTGIWPVLLAVFSINALGLEFTTFNYITLIVLTLVVGLGIAGVPGVATIAATAVLAGAGLPIEIIVVLAPISAIVDMARTMTNVTGSAAATAIVSKRDKN